MSTPDQSGDRRSDRSNAWPNAWAGACLAAALAVGGCTKPGGNGSTAPDVATHGGKGSGPVAPVELAPVEHPAQLLPRGTALLVTGTSLARAAEVLERDRLVAAFGPQYTSMRAVIVGTVGHDLLDPAAWPAAGLDPDGQLGLAVSTVSADRFVLFATVKDRTKLVALIRHIAGKGEVEILEEPYGSASILRAKGEDDVVVVLRDRFAAIVIDGGGKGAYDLAKLMVTMDPNVSLASQAGYRKATGGLRAADMTMYLDVAGMVDQVNMQAVQQLTEVEPQSKWAEEELARAKKEGASPERLADLERQVGEARRWEVQSRQRSEGERALAELVVSGIEGVGLTATVKRSGPVLDGRVVAGEEAFVRRLLVNRKGAPALPLAMNGTPLWCGSGQVDPAAALELLEAVALADGEAPAEMRAEFKRGIGLDLEADLLPMLVGEGELCIAVEGNYADGSMNPKKDLGLGIIVRVSDAAQAKYVLAKIATSGSEAGKRMKKRGEGYTIDVPDMRTLHVQPAGDRVVVTTDPELAKRLVAGDPGSMPSKIRPAAATGAMGLTGTAASQALDLSLSVLWTTMGSASMASDVPMVVGRGLSHEEMDRVPLSAKTKKAKKAMQKAQAQLEVIENKRQAVRMKEMLAFTDGLGIVATAATEDDRGFTLTGGQFLRVESLGRVVEALLGAALENGGPFSRDEQDEMEKAWERYSAAQQAYSDARLEDAERYVQKKGIKTTAEPAPAPPQ